VSGTIDDSFIDGAEGIRVAIDPGLTSGKSTTRVSLPEVFGE